jgi:hypothetical protein
MPSLELDPMWAGSTTENPTIRAKLRLQNEGNMFLLMLHLLYNVCITFFCC